MYERGRALIPSWLAFAVTKLLETKFPKLVDYQFTAQMENGLDQIAHGKETGRDWLTRFYFGSGSGAAQSVDEAHEGLQQQVAQLGEIDARAINTIEIGDGLHVRVGRYGPYLEDMEHLDAEGNPKRAERRAEVKKLAAKGWANTRIAEKIGSTASTVKGDIDWLTANEGFERPPVVAAKPARKPAAKKK